MQNALLVGLSRQVALRRELDVVANNIANLNTTGYKADGAVFEEFIVRPPGSTTPWAPQTGQLRAGPRDLARPRQGPLERTGNPLDVAIDGTASSRCRRRAASATRATARCRSTTTANSSPAKAIRCSANPARSRFSRTTAASPSAPTAPSACARATTPRLNRSAANSASSAFDKPAACRRTAAAPSRRRRTSRHSPTRPRASCRARSKNPTCAPSSR